MAPTSLTAEHRRLLARTVVAARREAEAGARESLRALAVDHHEPFGHMSPPARALRNALRAHGRQLGDALDPKRGTQEIGRLAHEVAFEHWHRMLFARFLAENGLLIHPTAGAAVTLEECHELARDEGKDPWELAASFAQASLPQIFRSDDPALRVSLPANARTALERLVGDLPAEVFLATDALGWVYQFWQAEKKDEVNASGTKIGADELPSVTQLFTEDYMVDFLLDNTLGAWWAGKMLAAKPELAATAASEDELRSAVSLPGCPWSYLRFIRSEAGVWSPAAGVFDGWPKSVAEITCLDPCMGSGHFIVAMFERLVALRLAEEKLDEAAAVATVIRDNLFGLEIDSRCTQIAAFNLALAAWRRVGHCSLPSMSLACSGLAPNTREADWLAIAGENQKLRNGMERLYRLFENAPVLGSLINPRAAEGDLLGAAFHELQPLLERVLAQETKDDATHEMAVTARGLAKAAEILAGQFTLVATNVPYLGSSKQDDILKKHCVDFHDGAKADLATAFIERGLELCATRGSIAFVAPQNWLFLESYTALRNAVLATKEINGICRLGPKGFQTPMWDFNVMLFVCTRSQPADEHSYFGISLESAVGFAQKSLGLPGAKISRAPQNDQLSNPGVTITFGKAHLGDRLATYVETAKGICTGDRQRWVIDFWEQPRVPRDWTFFRTSSKGAELFDGCHELLLWEEGSGSLFKAVEERLGGNVGAWIRGESAWGRPGISVSRMAGLPAAIYLGELFDDNCCSLIPIKAEHASAVFAFCKTEEFYERVRSLNQKLSVDNTYLQQVPFDLTHWQKVAAERYPHGLPKPFSSDPTQWLFNGHPAGADQPLHVAVARLLGYQWPRQTGSSFPDCPGLGPDGLEKHADDDGIVPINPMRGEPAASERLVTLLRDAYTSTGQHFDLAVASKLLAETGGKATEFGDWLLNEFFEQHCKLFHDRPFVWHVWDGRKDGFNVLVNYHRMAAPDGAGRQLLEKLTYDYLKDWIGRQQAGVKAGESGAEARLASATKLQKELVKIIEGEPPYDIFVRWKPLSEQSIGWEPDLNDGVRMNIRPFLMAADMGKKGAGVLRMKPNIKWEKDRGKEPERPKADFPWFWSCDPESNAGDRTDFAGGREFTGERWNGLHYTNAAKAAARQRRTKEKM